MSPDARSRVVEALDPRLNPDAPEMYEALAELMADWRSGRCALRFYVNHGPEIGPDHQIAAYCRATPSASRSDRPPALLDLVIEQQYTPLEYAARRGHWAGKEQLLDWLQDSTLLLYTGATGPLELDPRTAADSRLPPAASRLAERGLMEVSTGSEAWAITDKGKQALAGMMAGGGVVHRPL